MESRYSTGQADLAIELCRALSPQGHLLGRGIPVLGAGNGGSKHRPEGGLAAQCVGTHKGRQGCNGRKLLLYCTTDVSSTPIKNEKGLVAEDSGRGKQDGPKRRILSKIRLFGRLTMVQPE